MVLGKSLNLSSLGDNEMSTFQVPIEDDLCWLLSVLFCDRGDHWVAQEVDILKFLITETPG